MRLWFKINLGYTVNNNPVILTENSLIALKISNQNKEANLWLANIYILNG